MELEVAMDYFERRGFDYEVLEERAERGEVRMGTRGGDWVLCGWRGGGYEEVGSGDEERK